MNTTKILTSRLLPCAVLAALTAATIYMSIRSSSRMSEIIWIPGWLGQWADQNPDLRTSVPFFLLSLICPVAVGTGKQPSTNGLNTRWLLAGYAAIAVLLVTSECSQYFIQTRFLSIGDILWGLFGIAAGICAGLVGWWQGMKLIAVFPKARPEY
ncbi:MAG: hypothetical protein AB3N33_10705 [Puniceicoccaceae bacterium]